MKRNEVKRNERTLCLVPFLEDGTCGTKRDEGSGSGTKYGWSERQ